MTDQTSSDLLMRFINRPTRKHPERTVLAESMLDIPKEDKFLEGFEVAPTADDWSNFFEISSFGISLAAKPQDQTPQGHDNKKAGVGGTPRAAGGEWNTFYRWASQRSNTGPPKIRVEFERFSFSRIIDVASMTFFQQCCDQDSFEEAILVKRVSTGLQGGDKRQSMGYLKFVFSDVLLVSFGWDDGELITENCEFICKKMTLNYKQQDAAGMLSKPVGQLIWDQGTDDRIKKGMNRNGHG
jgi:type VI protein secretion system component Hcp